MFEDTQSVDLVGHRLGGGFVVVVGDAHEEDDARPFEGPDHFPVDAHACVSGSLQDRAHDDSVPLDHPSTRDAYRPGVVANPDPPSRLTRSLGLGGAVVVGMSAMIGTGVFAVWQPALELAGPWLVMAVLVAGFVAAVNATSTARLAALHPEAGGVYAYARIYLDRWSSLLAGSVFVVGKTASAAAAALTIGVYLLPRHSTAVALAAIAVMLAVDLRGIVRSVRVAAIMVSLVVVIVLVLVAAVAGGSLESSSAPTLDPGGGVLGMLAASALLFVAFAGYARVTILGEEVRNPARTIPRAVTVSFIIVASLYLLVAVTVMTSASLGVELGLAALSDIAAATSLAWLPPLVTAAAVLAAGAVLMSLIAGVGRTLFAMADRGDAPRALAAVGTTVRIPYRAEIAAAMGAAVLVLFGGLTVALGISAAMILTYYAVGHLAAMRLPRRPGTGGSFVRLMPYLGLVGCVVVVGALVAEAVLGG